MDERGKTKRKADADSVIGKRPQKKNKVCCPQLPCTVLQVHGNIGWHLQRIIRPTLLIQWLTSMQSKFMDFSRRKSVQTSTMEPGDAGVWVSCVRGMEARAEAELQKLFDEVSCLANFPVSH